MSRFTINYSWYNQSKYTRWREEARSRWCAQCDNLREVELLSVHTLRLQSGLRSTVTDTRWSYNLFAPDCNSFTLKIGSMVLLCAHRFCCVLEHEQNRCAQNEKISRCFYIGFEFIVFVHLTKNRADFQIFVQFIFQQRLIIWLRLMTIFLACAAPAHRTILWF